MSGPPAPAPSAASKAKSKKRKAQDASQPAGAKKQKSSKYEEDESMLDLEAGVNTAFVRMDPQLLADHVARQTKRFGTDLSSVELSDLYISANAVRDTTDFTEVRVKENLPDFLELFAPGPDEKDAKVVEKERKRLGDAPPKVGAPHTIIVTGAGLRAADLVRATRKFQKKGNVVSKLVSLAVHSTEGNGMFYQAQLLTQVRTVCKTLQGRGAGAVSQKEQDWHRGRNSRPLGGPARQR